MRSRTLRIAAVAVVFFAVSGANCHRPVWLWQSSPPPPAVLSPQATLEQVTRIVNGNRARVTSLLSSRATLRGSGFPAMRASLAIGSPQHVRLKAGTGLSGSEIDLGSNQELFWFWVKRNQPPGVFFARHQQFEQSPARRMFPVRPDWLAEAMGLVNFDPRLAHYGPFRRSDGKLEIHTPIGSAEGQMKRVVVVDPQTGWVVEQHLFDPRGQVVARAVNGRHTLDPASGAVLPRMTTISWPSAGMEMSIELHELEVNAGPLDAELWTKPIYPGFPERDLAAPSGVPATASGGPYGRR